MSSEQSNFEKAMKTTILWNNSWEAEEISDEVLADRVSNLIKTEEGARGFFVISLSTDSPLMDRLPDPLVFTLRSAGELIVDLTTKNLAMSTAMSIYHKKKGDEIKQNSSKRISSRCIELLILLEPNLVKKRIELLIKGLEGEGVYSYFLNKWGYNKEQKEAISQVINKIVLKKEGTNSN